MHKIDKHIRKIYRVTWVDHGQELEDFLERDIGERRGSSVSFLPIRAYH